MKNKELYGKWMMLVPGNTYVVPSGYIEEITRSHLIVYSYDKKHSEYPLKINPINQKFIVGSTNVVDYHITKDKILKKIYKNEENKVTEIQYVKLAPTLIRYPLKKVLNNQYKLLSEEISGPAGDQIFDFRNLNASRFVDLHIENILGTHFIIGYQRKKKSWFFPIKEIQKEYLVIYGLSATNRITKLRKYTPKKTVSPKGNIDVFYESKLTLLIEELKKQKDGLKQELDDATTEKDFLAAHYLMNNYQRANREFNTACSIKNKNHQLIANTEFLLEQYQEMVKNETNEYRIRSLKEYIEECEEKIGRLKAEKQEPRPFTKFIVSAIIQLYDRDIQKIRLQLKEKYGVFLDIVMHANQLVLSLDSNGKEGYLDCNFDILKSLGFQQEENYYSYYYNHFNKDKVDQIMTLLSRVTFEAFYHESLDKPMSLILI